MIAQVLFHLLRKHATCEQVAAGRFPNGGIAATLVVLVSVPETCSAAVVFKETALASHAR